MVYKSIMTTDDLAFDSRHIWHPYTSMTKPLPVYPVVSAEGCELHLANGEHLVDGMFVVGGHSRLQSPAAERGDEDAMTRCRT
jgi:adenosylmethionine-8-amino-7-oxononanoate aminotransferase